MPFKRFRYCFQPVRFAYVSLFVFLIHMILCRNKTTQISPNGQLKRFAIVSEQIANKAEVLAYRMIYTKLGNMIYCPIQKNMNSQVHLLIAKYIYNVDFGIELRTMYETLDNQTNSSQITFGIDSTDSRLLNDSVVKFAIIRDPISKFLSAFLSFCYVTATDELNECAQGDVNYCGKDLRCLLAHLRAVNYLDHWHIFHPILVITHFAPQALHCHFRQHLDKYKLFMFDHSDRFTEEMRKFMLSRGIPRETLMSGWGSSNGSWLSELTLHESYKSAAELRKTIIEDPPLMNEIFEFVRVDYDFFQLRIPPKYTQFCTQRRFRMLEICRYRLL